MFLFAVIGCTPPAIEPQPDETLHRLFEAVFEERLRHSPMLQTQLGMGEADDRWDDFSDQAGSDSAARARENLARLRDEIDRDRLIPADRLSFRLLERELEMEVESEQWRYHDYPLNQEHGLQAELPAFLINTHTVDSQADAHNYIARLRGLDFVIEQIVQAMRTRTAKGIVPPKFVFEQVDRDIANLLTGEPFGANVTDEPIASPLWEDIRGKVEALELPAERENALLVDARDALVTIVGPAFETLRAAAQEQAEQATDDNGVWKLPLGDAYYRYTLRSHTTTTLDAEAIHQMGLAEVARIHDALYAIIETVDFDGDLKAFFELMRTSDRFLLPNTAEGREEYLRQSQIAIDRIEANTDRYFLTQPKAQLVLKRVEPFREASGSIAFYQPASLDGSRPGIYYTNLYRMNERPTFNIETIAYHEAIPGHHMQVSIAQELAGVPMFRRLAEYTAFDEGWALYAERLGKEMGGFEDPYADFGRLTQELWRACRLVVDTGIHAKRWTRQQTIDYHLANTPNPIGEIVKETERYIVLPGQATSYKVGMERILELREHARRTLGDRFDIREFHDAILTSGSVPLDIMAENVNGWINGVAAGTADVEPRKEP